MNYDIPSRVTEHARVTAQNLIHAYNRSTSDVPDIVQNMMLAIHRAMRNFQGKSSATTYMNGIINRFACNFGRTEKRRAQSGISFTTFDETAFAGGNLATEICKKETVRLVRQILWIQPEPYQSIGKLFLCGYSLREIAKRLNIKWGTFSKRTWRNFRLRLCHALTTHNERTTQHGKISARNRLFEGD